MICPACKKENEEGARFCSDCGAALIEEPIELALEQIQIPAASRKAHIVKVSASKKEEVATQAPAAKTPAEEPAAETTPETAAEGTAEDSAAAEQPAPDTAPTALDGSSDPTRAPMTMKSWIPVFLLCMIPGVNCIMLFVWAFSKNSNASKKSFARLMLIFAAILLVLAVVGFVVYAAFFNKNLLAS